MPWPTRRWPRIPETTRRRILSRDRGICCECGKPGATQVDHRVPRAQGGSDTDANLSAIHARPCHLDKTQREAAAARWAHKKQRPQEQHPGLRR